MESVRNVSAMRGPSYTIPKNVTLNQLLEDNLQDIDIGEKIAVIYEDSEKGIASRITYSMLNEKANQIARKISQHLRSANKILPNSDEDYVVAVSIEPSDKLIITLLAIWKLGAAYLPLDVNSPTNRTNHIFKEVNPLMLITDHDIDSTEKVLTRHYDVIHSEASTISSQPLTIDEMLPNSQSMAIILYTSGSTGIPKGVRIPHKVVLNRLSWQWRTFPFAQSETICVFKTALTFVDAVAEIWGPLLFSEPRTLLVVPKHVIIDPEKLVQTLDTYQVERFVLVPSLLQSIILFLEMMRKQNNIKSYLLLRNLKLWVCSGEPLNASLVNQFLNYFDTGDHYLCNFYGSTEIMGDVSYYAIHSKSQLKFGDKVPIGIPLDNTELYLLNSENQLTETGEIGELFVSGYNVTAGYVAGRDPEKFVQNPFSSESGFSTLYKTGDYARIVDNVLLYEGRTDSQIKVRGHRVDLSEVQATLNKIPSIAKSAVLCFKPGDINQAIVAFINVHPGYEMPTKIVKAELKKSLPTYAIPQVVKLEHVPLLSNGKVDRQKLLKMYAEIAEKEDKKSKIELNYKGVESGKMKIAKCLFETIISVLGSSVRKHISCETNFYNIGGNSLNCIHTITELREKGYIIEIADFISARNLGEIINKLQPQREVKENISKTGNIRKKKINEYRYEMLTEKHKESVFRIISDSFYEKADLEQWLVPKPKRDWYEELLRELWTPLIEKQLSFAVYSEIHGKHIGIALNFDAYDEPDVNIKSNLNIIFEFLEFLEGPIRERLLPVGKRQILHSFMLGTDKELTAAENIQVVTCMEEEILKLAKRKGFAGIFTTNTNALTQQLGKDVFNYQVLLDYQVNEYIAQDGTKPFAPAPNDQRATCCWKQI